MSIYYKNLDWPVLPTEMHDELFTLAHIAKNIRPGQTRIPRNNTNNVTIGYKNFHMYMLPDHIEQWCRNNLPIRDTDICRLQRFINVVDIPKHIDSGRSGVNYYVLSSAGPRTQWYSENQLVESIVVPQYQWVWLNTSKMHEVLNVGATGQDRIALSIFEIELRKDLQQMNPAYAKRIQQIQQK
jgi:hypothetical protein